MLLVAIATGAPGPLHAKKAGPSPTSMTSSIPRTAIVLFNDSLAISSVRGCVGQIHICGHSTIATDTAAGGTSDSVRPHGLLREPPLPA
jgi:hypothetical protein